ncbi:MAG: cupin domain-containing protein [Gammaproteobacteria bacterium]
MSAHPVKNVLRGLMGGMSLEDFNDQIRERRVAHFKSAMDPTLLESVFNMPRVEHLLRQDNLLTPYIDIFDGTDLRQFVDRQRKPGQTNFDVVADNLRRGATIRIRDVEKFDLELNELTKDIERHFVGRCNGNIYLTPPGKVGFPPHFDLTDVFVVQCNGKKHWQIHDQYKNMSELPLADVNWDAERFGPTSPPRDFELSRGDVLYLPRGVMHSAFCTDRESMHLTISLASVTFADLLRKAIASAAGADIELRRRVPWLNAADDEEVERLARQAKDRLTQLAANSDLSALLQQERSAFQQAPDVSTGKRG